MLDFEGARKWQLEAFGAFKENGCRGIVEVATGGGKTIFALMCFASLLKEGAIKKMVVVVPTIALADQWLVNFEIDLGLDPQDTALLTSSSSENDLRTANVIVINSARNISLPDEFKQDLFFVVDECHRAGSEKNALALNGVWGATLGLSATPDRQYDDGSIRHLFPTLGEKIYSYSVAEALRDGVLSPFDLFNVEIPLLPEERSEYERISKQIGIAMARGDEEEHLQTLLRRRSRLSNSAEYRIPVTVRILSDNRGVRTLVFHESIDAAISIHNVLKQKNHSVALYHSRLSPSIRRENLKMFRLGIIDVLVTCRALDEGANIPETCLAVVAAATASQRQRIQRLGRVLRPSPGKEKAVVFTLFATEVERRRLQEEQSSLKEFVSVNWLRISDGQ
jgi:superfamily II DNA or RNA helicase